MEKRSIAEMNPTDLMVKTIIMIRRRIYPLFEKKNYTLAEKHINKIYNLLLPREEEIIKQNNGIGYLVFMDKLSKELKDGEDINLEILIKQFKKHTEEILPNDYLDL